MAKIPSACEGCVRWDKYGNKCWVFWEEKKECTMHAKRWDEVQPIL